MKNMYGVIYGSLAEAAEELQKQIALNTYDNPRFYVAANLLFGDKLLSEWCNTENPIACIQKALNDNMQIFRDADTNGFSFLARVIALGAAGAFTDENGKKVLEVVPGENGQMNIKVAPDSMETILGVMQISALVYSRCGESLQEYMMKKKEGDK